MKIFTSVLFFMVVGTRLQQQQQDNKNKLMINIYFTVKKTPPCLAQFERNDKPLFCIQDEAFLGHFHFTNTLCEFSSHVKQFD